MSNDCFRRGDQSFTTSQPFRVEDIPYVETEKLETIERAAIERAISERETVIQTLQTDIVAVRSERDAFESQLTRLETERDEFRERVRQLEAERPSLEPKAVFTNLGSAIGDVTQELGETNYTIGDVDFTLKANVVQTEAGLRMHLPSLDETFASENLSEIAFRVSPDSRETGRTESEYIEVPDVVGRERPAAEQQLRRAGLSVGEVATVTDSSEAIDTVVDQFPDPHTLTQPDAPIDLTVVVAGENADSAVAPSSPSVTSEARGDDESEKLREGLKAAIERTELDAESELAARLADAGIDDLHELAALSPDEIAAIIDLPERTVIPLRERLVERITAAPTQQLETINGIGATYADRLRDAGVEQVEDLARLDPAEVAKITGASTNRTTDWIEQARSMVR